MIEIAAVISFAAACFTVLRVIRDHGPADPQPRHDWRGDPE